MHGKSVFFCRLLVFQQSMKGFLYICAWLDVSFVWNWVPDELYEVAAAGWNHFLLVEELIVRLIVRL
jgi:hypothetical protein